MKRRDLHPAVIARDCSQLPESMTKTSILLFLTLGCAFGVASSPAQSTTYVLRSSYESAHPNAHVINFNNYGPSGTIYPAGLTVPSPLGDIAFKGIQGLQQPRVEILDANQFGFTGSGNFVLIALDSDFNVDSLLITLPPNTFSFGTDMISPSQTLPETYQFTLYSGANVIDTLLSPSLVGSYTFIGYDSETDPITSIRVQITSTSGNSSPVLDNFTVVPEPSTIWLVGMGAASGILFARRRLRAVTRRATRG